ncbi:srpk, putative [Talaromyces stipitatus ATCC 10500]|uniref:non-specific serine/threonine protein kinase n=1 Tax=Talaromyces stipitatus (strain ATCC 10500 / CBS 375.48 / QM 6759 / NRRL 1006) TaxID=441959 RepID=B8ME83_TALSN|nr:srpk, putative [Talaromyces stipitatus ATCC 10500]EED16510.1 srpk, putative [Talaromyces stipitatus ATCC 10500]
MEHAAQYRKYKEIVFIENLEDYKSGGFHPIHIGDHFKENRYQILNKLGHGRCSTVWLAEDVLNKICVAISISQAQISQESSENDTSHENTQKTIRILQHLADGTKLEEKGRSNVLLPLDIFNLSGPNGTHSCIVTHLQGQSLAMVTKRDLGRLSEVLPLPKAKRAISSLLKGFAYIHSRGVCHGDLHPGNLLLDLPDPVSQSLGRINSICGPPRIVPIERLDGKDLEPNVPKYGVEAALGRFSDLSLYSGDMKVADFGCGYFTNDPPTEIDFFGPYIVPEQYCTGLIGTASDVWTVGCAIWLLLSGRDIFGTVNDPPEKVFSIMTDTLGGPPEFILRAWRDRLPDDDLHISIHPSTSLVQRVQQLRTGNEELWMKARLNEFSEEDVALVTELLTLIFKYDPADRPTLESILRHPAMKFFGDVI